MSDGHGDDGRPDRGTIQEPPNGTVDDWLGQQASEDEAVVDELLEETGTVHPNAPTIAQGSSCRVVIAASVVMRNSAMNNTRLSAAEPTTAATRPALMPPQPHDRELHQRRPHNRVTDVVVVTEHGGPQGRCVPGARV